MIIHDHQELIFKTNGSGKIYKQFQQKMHVVANLSSQEHRQKYISLQGHLYIKYIKHTQLVMIGLQTFSHTYEREKYMAKISS